MLDALEHTYVEAHGVHMRCGYCSAVTNGERVVLVGAIFVAWSHKVSAVDGTQRLCHAIVLQTAFSRKIADQLGVALCRARPSHRWN